MQKNDMDEKYYIERKEEDEIDLIEIFKTLWKGKTTIIIFMLVGLILSSIGGIIYKKKNTYSKTYISLNYDGISEGRTPDGTSFDKNKIISNSAINDAYAEYKKNSSEPKTITDFKTMINLNAVIPNNISKLMEQKLKSGEKYSYTPQDYSISLKSGLSIENNNKILETLTNETITDFTKKYRPFSIISKMNVENLFTEKLLYEDYIGLIDKKISTIIDNINNNNNNNNNNNKEKMKFKNFKSNYTYQDILYDLELIKKTKLDKIKSLLELKYISSDVAKSKLIIDNKILNLEMENKVLNKESEILSESIKNYKMSKKEILFSGDMKTSLNDKDEYYSKLIEKHINTSTKIKENEVKMDRLKIKKANMIGADKESNDKIIANLKEVINLVNAEIEKVNELDKAYYEVKYSEMIKQILPVGEVSTAKPIILIILIGLVFFGIIGCGFVLGKDYFTTYGKNYNQK